METDSFPASLGSFPLPSVDGDVLKIATQGISNNFTHGQCGTRGGIYLVPVMGLDDFNINGIAKYLGCYLQ